MKSGWLLGIGAIVGLAAGVLAPRSWEGASMAASAARDFTSSAVVGLTDLIDQRNENTAAASRGGGRSGNAPQRRGYAPVVSMATAERASVTRTIDVIGSVRSLKSVALTSEATGIVGAVMIKPGQRVSKGDILVQIVDDEQQVALARAQADFPIARQNAERFRDLESDLAASEQEAEQAQNDFSETRARLRAAEVAVEQRKIRAPFDGIAGLTDIEAGDYLRAGDVVTTLDDTSAIVVEFSVPQESAAFVNVGQSVAASLTSAANIEYAGEITAIDSRVNSQSRTLRVEAQVENSSGRLIPGAVVAVLTAADGEPAVAVPGFAVQWDRRGAYVWRRGDDDAAERVGIVILQRTGDRVLVDGALNVGDVVVAEGANRVRVGVPLPAPEAAAQSNAAGAADAAR